MIADTAAPGDPAATPLLYDVTAAGQTLSIGRNEIYHRIRTGEIRSVRIGRRRLIPATELAAFVDRLITEAAQSAPETSRTPGAGARGPNAQPRDRGARQAYRAGPTSPAPSGSAAPTRLPERPAASSCPGPAAVAADE